MSTALHARLEMKFIAQEPLYRHLLTWLHVHPAGFVEAHPVRRVNNVYFDTFGYDAYWTALAGVGPRAKARYRWYGSSPLPAAGQFEVKVKQGIVGWKWVHPIGEAPHRPGERWRAVVERLAAQLPSPARWRLRQSPKPVLINRYDRHYWRCLSHDVRATVDVRHRVFDQRYASVPDVARPSDVPNLVVLEFKCAVGQRAAVASLAAGLPLTVTRNSKYCVGLRTLGGH